MYGPALPSHWSLFQCNKYSLSVHYVPGIPLGNEDTRIRKAPVLSSRSSNLVNSHFHQVGIKEPQLNIKNPSLIKWTPSSSAVCTDPCRWNLKFHSLAPLLSYLYLYFWASIITPWMKTSLPFSVCRRNFISSEFIIGAISVPPALRFKIRCFCWMMHWQGLLVHPMLSTSLFPLQVFLLCWDFSC